MVLAGDAEGLPMVGGQGASANGDPSSRPKRNREHLIDSYEGEMRKARWSARLVGSLQAFSRFFAFCSLTWATVVLLGAFVSNLILADFDMVLGLLLLEAVRLASAAFFSQLVTKALTSLSQNPKFLEYNEDDQYKRALLARAFSHVLQIVLISPSIATPVVRLQVLHYYIQDIPNLHSAIRIFYILVLINGVVSLLALICSAIALILLNHPPEQSIQRYYDEILEKTFSSGVFQGDDFEFFDFAYKMLGRENARNVQRRAVVKHHQKLLEYLYAHRHGVDFLLIYLDSDNAFVQQAAANMVGFWADPTMPLNLPDVKLPANLLTKLADKLGYGQVGWAAADSFGGLARRDLDMVLHTVTSSNISVVNSLAKMVDPTSSRSLVFVRNLIPIVERSPSEQEPAALFTQPDILEAKLKQLLEKGKVHRLRVLSAYLLLTMKKLDSQCYPHIQAIRPSNDSYWYESEKTMLNLFYGDIADLSPLITWPEIREDSPIKPPSWIQHFKIMFGKTNPLSHV